MGLSEQTFGTESSDSLTLGGGPGGSSQPPLAPPSPQAQGRVRDTLRSSHAIPSKHLASFRCARSHLGELLPETLLSSSFFARLCHTLEARTVYTHQP